MGRCDTTHAASIITQSWLESFSSRRLKIYIKRGRDQPIRGCIVVCVHPKLIAGRYRQVAHAPKRRCTTTGGYKAGGDKVAMHCHANPAFASTPDCPLGSYSGRPRSRTGWMDGWKGKGGAF